MRWSEWNARKQASLHSMMPTTHPKQHEPALAKGSIPMRPRNARVSHALHLYNTIAAAFILLNPNPVGIGVDYLRLSYATSLTLLGLTLWRRRDNALFFMRTLVLVLPGYFATGVQLWDPSLYYSPYERISQTLDITLILYALTNLAFMGSEIGLAIGAHETGTVLPTESLRNDAYFFLPIIPLLITSFYIAQSYGPTLFVASYASTSGTMRILGNANAIGAILLYTMYAQHLTRPSLVKKKVLFACAGVFLIYGMLIRGGRQDVLSCLFGGYILYWGYQGRGAPISGFAASMCAAAFLFMEYFGYIRGNVLAENFDYMQYFGAFLDQALHPSDVISFSTISPITTTFANTVYMIKAGLIDHLWGSGYFDYILRTPPEFIYPNRPRDFAWIFPDYGLSAGGGFFELAEAYLNFGAIGAFTIPLAISFFLSRTYRNFLHRRSLFSTFILFGFLAIFLRGALYQTFAFYKSCLTAIILMWTLSLCARIMKARSAS